LSQRRDQHALNIDPEAFAIDWPVEHTIAIRTGTYSSLGGGPLVSNKPATVRADKGLVTITARPSLSAQSVLTNNNNARTGFYPESQLNPANVNVSTIAHLARSSPGKLMARSIPSRSMCTDYVCRTSVATTSFTSRPRQIMSTEFPVLRYSTPL
jgi:hypothetical protein